MHEAPAGTDGGVTDGDAEARVLLVEDELRVRNAVRRELERRRYAVLAARNTEEAVQILGTHRPDVIVLDLGLPDADGSVLLRALRRRGIRIPVAVYTGRALPSHVSADFERIGARVVYKTVSTEPLLSAVEELLGGRWTKAPSDAPHIAGPTFQQALARRLRRASTRDAELPILDSRVTLLQQYVANVEAPVEPVLEIVERDPRVAGAVLAEANSAFYGPAKAITDIRRACIQLGIRRVAGLATQMLVEGMFQTDREPYRSLTQGLWIESVVCARAAATIAESTQLGDADELYTLALLHNIGELIIVDIASKLPHDMGDAEADALFEELEKSHERIGELITNRWDLPPRFQLLAATHHGTALMAEPDNQLCRTVVMAGWKVAASVANARPTVPDGNEAELERLGVTDDDRQLLLEKARSWPAELRSR